MIVTDEETDVTELLWLVATVDVDTCDVFCEMLVILGVDFKVVDVVFIETPGGVVTWEVVVDFKVVIVTFFVSEVTEAVDGFTVDFEVLTVTDKTEVVDGFTVVLEDSFLLLASTGGTLPAESPPSTATFTSASTSSAPTKNRAQLPRVPSPIVLKAGRGRLVGPQPRWRWRELERCLYTPEPVPRPLPPRTPALPPPAPQ